MHELILTVCPLQVSNMKHTLPLIVSFEDKFMDLLDYQGKQSNQSFHNTDIRSN